MIDGKDGISYNKNAINGSINYRPTHLVFIMNVISIKNIKIQSHLHHYTTKTGQCLSFSVDKVTVRTRFINSTYQQQIMAIFICLLQIENIVKFVFYIDEDCMFRY